VSQDSHVVISVDVCYMLDLAYKTESAAVEL